MEFPAFFESAAANVPPASDDGLGQASPDWAQPYPAPWFVDPPAIGPDDQVTPIEIPPGPPEPGGPPFDIESRDWGNSGHETGGADAIAYYVPWHADPAAWGIYFLERPLFAFVTDVAQDAGVPANSIAPVVLRQVLFHELMHFQFEVVGSELEDVLGRPLYLDYLRYRFGRPNAGLSGPIEETLATWRKVRFARGKLQAFLRPKPPSYLEAVMRAASAAPPGYRDWKAAGSDRRREELVATVASMIADRPIVTGGWGNWLTEENKRSVPRRWVGTPSSLPAVGALQKSAPQVTVRAFERWLTKQGIKPVPSGNGSHRKFEYLGRTEGYGTSGSSGRFYRKDAKRLYKFFGYPTMPEFLIAVRAKRQIPRVSSDDLRGAIEQSATIAETMRRW